MNEVLFSKKDREEVCQMADYLIEEKRSGYLLLEPPEYHEAIKQWIKGDLSWHCDGGKYALEIDTDGKVGICGYLPYLSLNIMEIGENFFDKIKLHRERYQKWCTKVCVLSCMSCTSFYRQAPLRFLYPKLRYGI